MTYILYGQLSTSKGSYFSKKFHKIFTSRNWIDFLLLGHGKVQNVSKSCALRSFWPIFSHLTYTKALVVPIKYIWWLVYSPLYYQWSTFNVSLFSQKSPKTNITRNGNHFLVLGHGNVQKVFKSRTLRSFNLLRSHFTNVVHLMAHIQLFILPMKYI